MWCEGRLWIFYDLQFNNKTSDTQILGFSLHSLFNKMRQDYISRELLHIYMENCQQKMSNSVSCGLNAILNSLITIFCMQTTYITNIESLLQKIILWNFETL